MAKRNRCSIEGCTRSGPFARTWCTLHYRRWQRHGSPHWEPPQKVVRVCLVDHCEKDGTASRGWCWGHYERWRAHGDPLAGLTERGAPQRFLERVAATSTDGCIEWPFGRDKDGYGQVKVDGRASRAHLEGLALVVPRPHPDAWCLHSCDNPPCVNPRHLRWGTVSDNSADCLDRGRHARGSSKTNAKLTPAAVVQVRDLYAAGGISQDMLAQRYGVSQHLIARVIHRESWSHVP